MQLVPLADSNSFQDVIRGAAENVMKDIGPGNSESVYQRCLALELRYQGYIVQEKSAQTIRYREVAVGYNELDLLVRLPDDKFAVIELKSVDCIPVNCHDLARRSRHGRSHRRQNCSA